MSDSTRFLRQIPAQKATWLFTALLVACFGCSGGCQQQSQPTKDVADLKASDPTTAVLIAEGYTPIFPPSTLVNAGTVVAVIKSDPYLVSRVCSQEANIGDYKVESSAADALQIKRQLSQKFTVDANVLKKITAKAELSNVSNVTYTFTNVHVYDLSDDQVFANLSKRNASCKEAIAARAFSKQPLTLIQSAIVADKVLTVETSNGQQLSVDALQTLSKVFSASAAFQNQQGTTQSSTGTGLVWGVRDNSALVNPDVQHRTIGTPIPHRPILRNDKPVQVQ